MQKVTDEACKRMWHDNKGEDHTIGRMRAISLPGGIRPSDSKSAENM